MRLSGCSREPELSQLLSRGQWPEACSEELRAHVAGCRLCGELLAVRQALGRERSRATSEALVESPGVLWWRAQLRRRNAAIERIGRPILGAQIFALAVCLAAAIVYVVAQARRGFDWLAWLGGLPRAVHLGALFPESMAKTPWETWLAVSLAAMVAVMGGIIVYLGSEKQGTGIRGQGSDRPRS